MTSARKLAAATAVAALLVALPVGSATAATVTVGDPLTGPGYSVSGFSGGPYTVLNTTLVSGGPPAAPVPGTVISWAVGSPDGSFALQVLRPAGAGTYVATAEDPSRQLDFDPASSPPQPTSLTVAPGDLVALRTGGGTSLFQSNAGASARFDPALIPGGLAMSPGFTDSTNNYIFNATIRYCRVPKVKGKRLKAAKKLLLRIDCAAPKLKTLKLKCVGKCVRVVKKQNPAAGTAISDTEKVTLTVVARPRKK